MNFALLLETVCSVVLQVALLLLLTAVLERVSRSTKWNCTLWTIAFLATLTLVATAFLFPHVRWIRVQLFGGDTATLGKVLQFQMLLVRVAGVIWSLGFVISVIRGIHRYLALIYFLETRCRSIREREQNAIPENLRSLAPNNTRWLVSSATHGPFCWQLYRPTIILPLSLFSEDEETWRHVLLHEFEHLRVGHPVQHFLQGLCVTIFWFHPAVHWAAQHAELAREYWCDEVAAKSRAGVSRYLSSLAKIAEKDATAPPCTLGFGRRKSAIVLRSQRLLELSHSEKWSWADKTRLTPNASVAALLIGVVVLSQAWLPINLLASAAMQCHRGPLGLLNRSTTSGLSFVTTNVLTVAVKSMSCCAKRLQTEVTEVSTELDNMFFCDDLLND